MGAWERKLSTSSALAAALLTFAAAGCCPPSGIVPPAKPGETVEPLQAPLLTLDGEETSLEAYRGQVVLVDFWATWCGPCRLAFPYYAEIQARRRSAGFVVVAISIDETMEQARTFASRWGLPFEILYDQSHQAQAAFSVYQIPASFLLDRHGRVRFVHRGFDPKRMAKVEEEVLYLLTEQSP